MAILFEIKHTTTYSYANPVTFGTHRAMFLPRPAARGRLISWSARTNLRSRIRWISDGLSNNITEIEFDEPGKELTFRFELQGIHFGGRGLEQFALERRAEIVPVQYTQDGMDRPRRVHAPAHGGSRPCSCRLGQELYRRWQ